MPANWLFKSDPDTYGYDDLEREKETVWDGVSNNLALKNLRAVKKGDLVLIYHTGEEKSIIGLAEIIKEAYPDPKRNDPKLAVVNIRALNRLKEPVALADIRLNKAMSDFALVRLPRLSVMPVNSSQWKILMKMAGEKG